MSDNSDGTDALDYDPKTNTYRADYDPECDQPSLVLVRAVEAITEREGGDTPMLHEVVSPESLDELFRPTVRGGPRNDGRVEFPYHEFHVTVYSHGSIEIRPDPPEQNGSTGGPSEGDGSTGERDGID